MAKVLLREIALHQKLYRDPKTGIAWVEDGTRGLAHSAHPNIDATGSVRGMRALGHWGRHDRVVRSHGFCYNIESCIVDDELDAAARDACVCGGYHGRLGERFRFPDGSWSAPTA
jgi:hypothetical protein